MLPAATAGLAFSSAPLQCRLPRLRAPVPLPLMSMGDLLADAADGDIAAALEAAALAIAGVAGVALARSLVERDKAEEGGAAPAAFVGDAVPKIAIDVDLGSNGEPKGVSRLFFKPLLPRSEFVLLNLRVPLGLLIEEEASPGTVSKAGTIRVTGALPGYSSFGQVEEGDLLRAVTAYAAVAGDAPMWQQLTSGTPVGDVENRRLIFKTEGASCVPAPRLTPQSSRPYPS
eukprot:Transcript_29307.p1 GENE.Transcript_29307~~Transcript_29307.p1  ORF type:complete len:247 (-),score=79.18 Transcript_29307:347-1036(-)